MDRQLAPGVWQIDTVLGGWEEVNSVFLIEADQPCLVETGPERDAGRVLAALTAHGLEPGDLAWIVVSHVHLDHAGGVGELARQFPSAKVVCHPKGIRHLADPSRLIQASAKVYGDKLDLLYGRMTPVPADRLIAAEDGQLIDLGRGQGIRLIHSPGHAKHHIGVLEILSGVLLVGDAVGVKLPGGGRLRPATPPDDFDLGQALGSLGRFRELRPQQLVLTHFGSPGQPEAVLDEAEEALRTWASVARAAYAELPQVDHLEQALRDRLGTNLPAAPPAAEILTGFRSNAEGLFGWLERERSRTEPRASTAGRAGTGPQKWPKSP